MSYTPVKVSTMKILINEDTPEEALNVIKVLPSYRFNTKRMDRVVDSRELNYSQNLLRPQLRLNAVKERLRAKLEAKNDIKK